jgi:hypothetical protein
MRRVAPLHSVTYFLDCPSHLDCSELERLLQKAGLTPGPTQAADVIFTSDENTIGRWKTVALSDGGLGPRQAKVLRDRGGCAWLATGHLSSPDDWAARFSARWVNGAELLPDVHAEHYYVGQREGLLRAGQRAAELVRAHGAGAGAADAAQEVMYELAANAVLDAPADASGSPSYAFRRNEDDLTIKAGDEAVVSMAVQGKVLYLLAMDRFGRFDPAPLVRTLDAFGGKARVDSSGGGGGLGLRRILDKSALFAARIRPGQHTEALAVVELEEIRSRRARPKSVFFERL